MIGKIFLIIYLLPLITFISSCSESPKSKKQIINIDSIIYKPGTKEPFNGTWKGGIDSLKLEFDVVNGKKEGNFRAYYPNGKLLMSGLMKNNHNVGEWKYYYDNGAIESSGYFEDDKPEGRWLWYYSDSTLKQSGYFHLGIRDSIWKSYDTSGVMIDSTVIDSTSMSSDSTIPHLPL